MKYRAVEADQAADVAPGQFWREAVADPPAQLVVFRVAEVTAEVVWLEPVVGNIGVGRPIPMGTLLATWQRLVPLLEVVDA